MLIRTSTLRTRGGYKKKTGSYLAGESHDYIYCQSCWPLVELFRQFSVCWKPISEGIAFCTCDLDRSQVKAFEAKLESLRRKTTCELQRFDHRGRL